MGDVCAGVITSGGYNLSSDDSCALVGPGDIVVTKPFLGLLRDNGGPTWTHALVGGPAIDTGDDGLCPPTDQRGVVRPQDGDGDSSARCDIGAYEYDGPLPTKLYLPMIVNS